MNGTICSVTVRLCILPAASALSRQFSSTQLTTNIQTVAAIFSLVNDFRIFNKIHPLGFINPLIYSGGFRGLKDVMFGGNPGCNTDGFLAAEGWDPVRHVALVSFPSHCPCGLICPLQ